MELQWSAWARARMVPFPGDEVEIDAAPATSLNKQQALAEATDLRVAERYDPKGNHPRDSHAAAFVDRCVVAGGVAFATEVLLAARGDVDHYKLRRDAQPWWRLREHLAAAPAEQRAKAKAIAAKARTAKDETRFAVAFAFCERAWVAEDLEAALEDGYGALCVLAALSTPAQAKRALERLLGKDDYSPAYQLVEESPHFMPNLMRRLDDADAGLVLEAAKTAWSKATRKPWLEIAACLPGKPAQAFLAEHAYVAPKLAPAKTTKASAKPARTKPAAKKPAAKKPAATKPAAKKPATKKPATKKPAATKKR